MEDYNDRKDRAFREYMHCYFRSAPMDLQLRIPFEEFKDDMRDFAALEWDFKSGFDYAYIHVEITEADLDDAALAYDRELGEEPDEEQNIEPDEDDYEWKSLAALAFIDGALYCMNNLKSKLRQLPQDSLQSDIVPQEPTIIRPFVERALTDIQKHNHNGLLAADNNDTNTNTNDGTLITLTIFEPFIFSYYL